MVVIINILGKFAFDASFSFNIVGDVNNMDLTDVSGNILHSMQNNSQDQDHTKAKKCFKVQRGVAGLVSCLVHTMGRSNEKLYINSITYMDTHHQPYWLGK